MKTENKYKQQIDKNYPCDVCKHYRRFISTINPSGKWVCTECHYTINNKSMDKWLKVERKLLKSGYVFKLGVKLTFKDEKFKNFSG